MQLSCPVSIGEVLDKISILRIKQERIKDPGKLAHIRKELDLLTKLIGDAREYEPFLKELHEHNSALWDLEDAIRLKEKNQQFDADFIALARSVYKTNDKRFEVKNRVNQKYNSAIQEQKSYEKY